MKLVVRSDETKHGRGRLRRRLRSKSSVSCRSLKRSQKMGVLQRSLGGRGRGLLLLLLHVVVFVAVLHLLLRPEAAQEVGRPPGGRPEAPEEVRRLRGPETPEKVRRPRGPEAPEEVGGAARRSERPQKVAVAHPHVPREAAPLRLGHARAAVLVGIEAAEVSGRFLSETIR